MKRKTTTKPWAVANTDQSSLRVLQKLVAEGEGPHLEFKRKAAYPEKIVRELIAFANTDGGTLLIGVDDDGSIPGTKYPDEELHVVQEAIKVLCRPALVYHAEILNIGHDRFVLRLDVPQSSRRPHSLNSEDGKREWLVRYKDKSVKASHEMKEIIERSRKKKDIQFIFGEHERQLMQYLAEHTHITLEEFQKLAKINRYMAARKLILLVLASVLRIAPTEKGDLYSRA